MEESGGKTQRAAATAEEGEGRHQKRPRRFLLGFRELPTPTGLGPALPTCWLETPGAHVIRVEVPGVSLPDVALNLDGDGGGAQRLTVEVERDFGRLEEDERWRLNDRHFGRLSRSFDLSPPVDPRRISTSVSHGVLTVTLPKSGERGPVLVGDETAGKHKPWLDPETKRYVFPVQGSAFPMSCKDTPGLHLTHIDVPGLPEDRLKVRFRRRDTISIEAERQPYDGMEDAETTVHVDERWFGKACLAFCLPEDAMTDQARTALENGVLTISVPKDPDSTYIEDELKLLYPGWDISQFLS